MRPEPHKTGSRLYIVNAMSRWTHRRPGFVCELGDHALRFLNCSKDWELWYDWGSEGEPLTPVMDWNMNSQEPSMEFSMNGLELIGYAEAHQQGP